MKRIAIIGAMDAEIEEYLRYISHCKKIVWADFIFYEGILENQPVVITKSGVGKVFASMVCQKLLDSYDISSVIFTGVAGSLNVHVGIGDVIIGVDAVHHDFDTTQLGFKRGQIAYTDYRFFKSDPSLVALALSSSSILKKNKVLKGRVLTGDQFMSQKEKDCHKFLFEELKGDCIEMEGAAVAQVCVLNKVSHIIIRTMSDKANGDALKDYTSFFPLVAKNSFLIVQHILKNL